MPVERACRLIRLLLIVLFVCNSVTAAYRSDDQGDNLLAEGKVLTRPITGSGPQLFQIGLSAGQLVHISVEQQGIDLTVLLSSPNNSKLAEIDFVAGTRGTEPIIFITELSGDYRVQVCATDPAAAPGQCRVSVKELRAARPQDPEWLQGQLLYLAAERLYAQDARQSYQQAIEKFLAALPHFRAAEDRASEARTLNYIGMSHYVTGDLPTALQYGQQALELRRALGDKIAIGQQLGIIGLFHYSMGEIEQALDYYQQSLALKRAEGNKLGVAVTLHNIGVAYFQIGDTDKALDYYRQALPIHKELNDPSREGLILHSIGSVYRRAGNLAQALEHYDQALALRRKANDRRGQAYTLAALGLLYAAQQQYEKALACYQEALTLQRAAGDRRGEAQTLNYLGELNLDTGDAKKARAHLEQALEIARAVSDPGSEALALFNIARAQRHEKDLAAAQSSVEAALAIADSVRARARSQELRTSFFTTVQSRYEFYIDLLMERHELQPGAGYDGMALTASERARARTLLELLADARADIRQGIAPALRERERKLQQQLIDQGNRLTNLKSGKTAPAELEAAEGEYRGLTLKFERVRAEIEEAWPRYAALTQPQPLAAKEIQQQILDDDTILLEYTLGARRSFVWAVTKDALRSFTLPPRGEIEAAAQRVYDLLSARNRVYANAAERRKNIAAADSAYPAAAAALAKMVLAPVTAQLPHKRLLIAADGLLQYIPFAALPLSGSDSAAEFTPLITRYEVVNLPSASSLALLRREQRAATRALAIFADPVFSPTDPRLKQARIVAKAGDITAQRGGQAGVPVDEQLVRALRNFESGINEENIPRLLATRDEAEAIAGLVAATDSKIALGLDASRAAVMDEDLTGYRLLHFATHGLVNSRQPELSGIVLSLFDGQGRRQNGFLRLGDIFNLRLAAELVVLSACQTALGKEMKGEGLIGLTRGFMYAGTSRVMASLWKIDDEGTAELMKRFYAHVLKNGMRPATALRQAQLEMLTQRRWQTPFYWAAFQLQGEYR